MRLKNYIASNSEIVYNYLKVVNGDNYEKNC